MAAVATEAPAATTEASLEGLPSVRGVLPNGLRYVIVRHSVPAGVFEAHLEFHVGSVDEDENQRGMAHMLEHICFLGSEKRTSLMSAGCGLTSNALTDFHHTIYHLNLPSSRLPEGFDMLAEVGFSPAFSKERIEKERAAVLSEAQMVNDCQYRMQTQILGAVHDENRIHERFPIGLESQIARWTPDELQQFHSRWYAPENATLYVVGDVSEDAAIAEIERAFGGFRGAGEPATGAWGMDSRSLFRPPMPSRQDVLHEYATPGRSEGDPLALAGWSQDMRVSVATNELVQGMQVCWAAKGPMQAARKPEDLLQWLYTRLVVEGVRLRLQVRWGTNAVPCNFHLYDSIMEGVQLSTLTVMSEPSRWRDTCQDVLQEVLAISRYGFAKEELEMTLQMTLTKVQDSAERQPWASMGTLFGYDSPAATSRELVEAMIGSAPCGHLLTSAEAFSAALKEAAAKVDLAELNKTTAEILGHFGGQGKAKGTVVVACPAAVTEEFSGRRVPLTPPSKDEVVRALTDVTELGQEEVQSKLVSVPLSLLPSPPLVAPLERKVLPGGAVSLRLPCGMTVRILARQGTPDDGPNPSTMRLTIPGGRAADAQAGRFGTIEAGVLALESGGVGEWSREQGILYRRLHSVTTEMRTNPDAVQVDAHFSASLDSSRAALEWLHWFLREPKLDLTNFGEAQLRMKGNAHARSKSLEGQANQILMQKMYPQDTWLWDVPLNAVNELTLSKARKAAAEQMGDPSKLALDIVATIGGGGPSTSSGVGSMQHEEGEASSAGGASAAMPGAAELVEEMSATLEREVCSILGSLPPAASPTQAFPAPEPKMSEYGCEERIHVPDADERALVLVGGGLPNYWGVGDATWQEEISRKGFSWARSDQLYPAKVMDLLEMCMNSRLNGRVRDQLSLTYHCDLQLKMFEGFQGGHFITKVYSDPTKVAYATQATMQVLRSPSRLPFMDMEVEACKKVLVRRIRMDQRERGYWVGKLKPAPSQEAVRTQEEELEVLRSITADDVQHAWAAMTSLDDPFVVLAVSGSPNVVSYLPPGQVVERSPRPPPAAPAFGGGGAGMDFLD